MIKKIKINIAGFGERYCSDNVRYKLFVNKDYYIYYFYKFPSKNNEYIHHNEYGPAIEYKDKSYAYLINHKCHRLGNVAYSVYKDNYKQYNALGKYLGTTKEEFIKNLANVLIPKDLAWL